jgi:hypothetical protein
MGGKKFAQQFPLTWEISINIFGDLSPFGLAKSFAGQCGF